MKRLRAARQSQHAVTAPGNDDPEHVHADVERAEVPSDFEMGENQSKEGAEPVQAPVPTPAPAPPKKANPYRLKQLDPLRLFAQLGKDFKKFDWAEWVSEALWHAIVDKYGSEPTREAKNIIGALRSLLHSEAFWTEPHVFMWTCAALNQRSIDLRTYPELDPVEVMYAAAVVEQIRNKDAITISGRTAEGVTYGPHVLATVAAIFLQVGMLYVPPPLDGANAPLLSQVDKSMHRLHDEVAKAWASMGGSESVPKLADTPLGFQLERLFAIREYIKERTHA